MDKLGFAFGIFLIMLPFIIIFIKGVLTQGWKNTLKDFGVLVLVLLTVSAGVILIMGLGE